MLDPCPTATHNVPFHATAYPKPVIILFPSPFQVLPSFDQAIVLLLPPTATIKLLGNTIRLGRAELYARPYPLVKRVVVRPIQLVPLFDQAI